jgi:hypothetical protein
LVQGAEAAKAKSRTFLRGKTEKTATVSAEKARFVFRTVIF